MGRSIINWGGITDSQLDGSSEHPLTNKAAAAEFLKQQNFITEQIGQVTALINGVKAMIATTQTKGMTQLTTASNITDANAYALSGIEKNASISGTLAQKMAADDQRLTDWIKVITANQTGMQTNTTAINALKNTVSGHTSSISSIQSTLNIRHKSFSGDGSGQPPAVTIIKNNFNSFPEGTICMGEIWNGWMNTYIGYHGYGAYGFFVIMSYSSTVLTLLRNYGGTWDCADLTP